MGDEVVRRLEGDCIRLSEELYEARAANAELAKDARDGAHWEAVADRMREEIARLNELLRYEHNRANSAIDREETAEKAAEESQQEVAQLRSAWRAATATTESWRRMYRRESSLIRELLSLVAQRAHESSRYRLAWLSARRRAADEANFGMEALAVKEQEIERLRFLFRHAQDRADTLAVAVEALRQTTDAPRLEYADEDEDGEVWRLAGS